SRRPRFGGRHCKSVQRPAPRAAHGPLGKRRGQFRAGMRMAEAAPVVLVADTAQALPLVARLLGDEFEIRAASTWDDAVRCLGERPHVAIVGYHFDGMRPYRLLQKIREEAEPHLGVVLIRALPVLPQRTDEEDI